MSEPSSRRSSLRPKTVEDAVSRYLESLDSGGSRATMRSPLSRFARFCEREGIDRVGDLETGDLREYAFHLRERHVDGELKASTANTYFDYVRAFLSFCVREELLDRNPAHTNRATEYLPEDKGDRTRQFWSPEQRERIIAYATERVDTSLEGTIDVSRELAFRDRAIVVLLAEAGVRGAEIFRDTNDDARDGLRWGDVDLERKRMRVFGKSRQYEEAALPTAARDALERYRRVLEPPSDEWPVFPTGHAPSKWAALRAAVDDVDESRSIDDLLRDHEVTPPALTKEGGRRVMKRLTEEANIRLEGDADYLQPHGARRALGAELYEQGHSELAQSALRHKSIETTHQAYSDIQAADVADSIDEIRK
ncbi:tyrosine-type recombinase/integrase [Natrarchaeobius oligotrophus]|uniref:Integrase n=1 Tax=Natrarchaeobius chitinivorans TaxID=1679083 RepID=A0A3N6PGW5_NATCH|nr:tyrosine-type recombinase/integrase [Natrarchaeobius chitinivorans]RQG99629.1 integrase [Natrarchaeobius chitinivorans]